MDKPKVAITRISQILQDNANYQTNELKLGAIWNYCTWAADYKIRQSGAIEVMAKGE